MGALQALVTIVGLIGILAFLLLTLCRYLGGWTRTRTWLTSSREEKMVLTRGSGQFHPNGFMIRSESDLNISGRGSFRRFDKTDQDYQLLRQGSIVSIRSNQQQQSIPPQPLRPAPSLPPSSAGVVAAAGIHSQLEQQNSTDSVFTRTDSPVFPRKETINHQSIVTDNNKSMPPPRIPPPPPNNSVSSSNNSSSNTPRSLPSFSMTNPFLPLLQASTQFFSQTLQGIQNFQQQNSLSRGGSLDNTYQDFVEEVEVVQGKEQPPAGYVASTSAAPVRPTSIHSSTSSARSGISMGELLFSASPSVTTEMSNSRIANPHPPPPPCEFFNSSDYSHERMTGGTTRGTRTGANPSQDSTCSNPFSPPPAAAATPPPPVASSSVTSHNNSVVSEEKAFTWSSKPERARIDLPNYDTVTNSAPAVTNSAAVQVTNSAEVEVASSAAVEKTNSAAVEATNSAKVEAANSVVSEAGSSTGAKVGNLGASEVTNLVRKEEPGSIFEQIRDFNEMSLNKNLESERMDVVKSAMTVTKTSASSHFLPPSMTTTVESVRKSIQISNFANSSRLSHMKQSSLDSALDSRPKIFAPSSLSNVSTGGGGGTENRDPLKIMNSSAISSSGHYSCFPSYRNARSFSLRQASTDSIGSESDLGSPDGSLPSLQRAMSCDSVCSDTSVVLGELDQTQLTGHLCVGLEYDSETADLLVNVMEAKEINGLHPDPSTPFDSYVRVYLLPDKTTNMQTRVYRKSLSPIYKEKFMFGLETAELPIRSLMFYMYATDKYSNTLIGEAELKLRDVDVHQLPLTTWLPLTDSGQRGGDFGEIMFSLSYLPTAERLTVVIVKGRNLKFPRDNVGDPFVKVYLLQRGKKVSKKKSSTKRGEKNPIFNEAMIFGVPAHALQTIQLRITVADCSDSDGNRAYSVGHVIVGSMSTGKPLSHWNQMLSSLRKPIAMWHSLRK